MKHNKSKPKVINFFTVIPALLLLSACAPSQDTGTPNVTATDLPPYPIYEVENVDGLYLKEPFDLTNYYIRDETDTFNHYYIDSDHVLWGHGSNEYGQLGNGEQYIPKNGYENSFESTLQRIAEDVVHVDSDQYFVIYLTKEGDLYGIGANLNGIMGMEVTEQNGCPTNTVAVKPTLLMQNVTYARASIRGIIALKTDQSVWWWGEITTTSAKNVTDTSGVCYSAPEKMLDDAVYVTCGNFSMAAVKEDGSLWTWGNNTFGSCGIDSNDKDFIEEPVMVETDVKMVWMDQVRFDSTAPEIDLESPNPYECDYTYVTFIEKKDGTLWAAGPDVKGPGSKRFTYMLYGDILRTPDQENGGIKYDPVTISYSDHFQQIDFTQKDITFGMSSDSVIELK